jgi:hypothetical protein
VAPHGQEQLVLSGRQPRLPSAVFAPAQEPAQAVSELEQSAKVGVAEIGGLVTHGVVQRKPLIS